MNCFATYSKDAYFTLLLCLRCVTIRKYSKTQILQDNNPAKQEAGTENIIILSREDMVTLGTGRTIHHASGANKQCLQAPLQCQLSHNYVFVYGTTRTLIYQSQTNVWQRRHNVNKVAGISVQQEAPLVKP